MATQTYTGTVVIVEPGCGCAAFGMPDDLYRRRRRDHRDWWCPTCGSNRHWPQESKEERLARQLANEQEHARSLHSSLTIERNSHRATKGHLTRQRKRAAAALCPVPGCKRRIVQMARHLATIHPDWNHDDHGSST